MIAQVDRLYGAYGMGKVARRVASYAFFEGRPHTTKGQWFNPVVFGLLKTLRTWPGRPGVEKPIFITGLGRSGTTILGVLLSLHRDIGFLNEPKAIWSLIHPSTDINADYIGSGGRFRLTGDDVTAQAVFKAYRLFGRYLGLTGATRLLDKYPELIFRTEYLLKLFPDARIIFIARNGADACQSIVRWSEIHGVNTGSHIDDWWGRGDAKWCYLRDQILLQDPQYAEIRTVAAAECDHIHRAALEWIVTMREGLHWLERYPNSVIGLKYEDLVSKPRETLTRLLAFCELDWDSAVFSYAQRKLYETGAKPMPKLVEPVNELFLDTMSRLEYGNVNDAGSNKQGNKYFGDSGAARGPRGI